MLWKLISFCPLDFLFFFIFGYILNCLFKAKILVGFIPEILKYSSMNEIHLKKTQIEYLILRSRFLKLEWSCYFIFRIGF